MKKEQSYWTILAKVIIGMVVLAAVVWFAYQVAMVLVLVFVAIVVGGLASVKKKF